MTLQRGRRARFNSWKGRYISPYGLQKRGAIVDDTGGVNREFPPRGPVLWRVGGLFDERCFSRESIKAVRAPAGSIREHVLPRAAGSLWQSDRSMHMTVDQPSGQSI